MRRRGFGLLLVLLALLPGCGGPAEEPAAKPKALFRFSAIPDEKPTEQVLRFAPVVIYLRERLPVPVQYVALNRYSASVQAFKNRDVHGAWFGGLSGVQARQAVPGSRAIAQGVEDPEYYSYFIANRATGLSPGDDFPMQTEGMKLSFGSEGSTSGRLMPEFFVRQATGRAPEEFFGAIGFSGNHPATIAAVDSGAFDVGALNYRVYDDAAPEEKANTFVLWKTPVYADYNFTIHGDLDAELGEGFTEALTRAWLSMPREVVERSFSRSGMIPADNADFEKIAETAKALGLAR